MKETSSSPKDQEEEESKKRRNIRIALAEKALSIYSPSGQEAQLAAFIFTELERHGLSPRIDTAGNVVCEVGSGPHSILFCPHMDTVPGRLEVRRENNVLFGRGACDAKGALLSMLFAFEDIVQEFQSGLRDVDSGRVIFAAVVEEEKESRGLTQLIKDQLKAEAAIFGEPCGLNRITIGYRGHVPVSFDISTRAAHASAPWMTTNAAEVAFSLYESLKSKLSNGKDPQSIESVSVALTKINSGTAHNVIPDHAEMSLDIRIPLGITCEAITEKIRGMVKELEKADGECGIEAAFAEPTEAYKARLDSKLVRAMNRSILKLGFDKPSFVSKSGTGDMNTYALTFGVDAVTYGPGDTKLSHTESEEVDIDEIFNCARVLANTASEFFALQER